MWQIIGQGGVVSRLQSALERGSLAHAYLLVGPEHIGKLTLALNLAQALNCAALDAPCGVCGPCQKIPNGGHADVQVIGVGRNGGPAEAKSQTEISIDQIRQMQHSASLPPFEGKHKVFIINGAELLSTEAANCLLKTLEEPVGKVLFLLLTANDSLVLPTVISRCQRIELRPIGAAEIESALIARQVEPAKARLLSRLCHGCPGWAVIAADDDSLLQQRAEQMEKLLGVTTADYDGRFTFAAQLAAQFGQNKESVYRMLELWLDYWRDAMLVKVGCNDAVTNIDRLAGLADVAQECGLSEIKSFINNIEAAGEQLRLNANPRLALEVLMLDMPRKEVVSETASLTHQ